MVASMPTRRIETVELDKTAGSTISRDALVERLGEGAGTELFVRLDDAYRQLAAIDGEHRRHPHAGPCRS